MGVGVNPGAEDFENEMRRFYWKVEAGAEYCITQPVFDLAQLERFVERIDKDGLRIPVVAGDLAAGVGAQRGVPGQRGAGRGGAGAGAAAHAHRQRARQGAGARRKGRASPRRCWPRRCLMIQGVQVSAPFGKVPLALRVFDAIPGMERRAPAAARAAGAGVAAWSPSPGPLPRDTATARVRIRSQPARRTTRRAGLLDFGDVRQQEV